MTLDGVVYDPAGTLTGGSRPQATSLLEQLQRINDLKDQLSAEKEKLQEFERNFARTRDSSREYQVFLENGQPGSFTPNDPGMWRRN